jgi:hypothetical protein
VLYAAIKQGPQVRVTWGDDVNTQQTTYPVETAQGFIDNGTWDIRQVITREVDSLEEANGVALGDRVVVTNSGASYSGYEEWAKAHDLTGWSVATGHADVGTAGTVVEIGRHHNYEYASSRMLYGIRRDDGTDFIMEKRGFELMPKEDDDVMTYKATGAKLKAELAAINRELATLQPSIDALLVRKKQLENAVGV